MATSPAAHAAILPQLLALQQQQSAMIAGMAGGGAPAVPVAAPLVAQGGGFPGGFPAAPGALGTGSLLNGQRAPAAAPPPPAAAQPQRRDVFDSLGQDLFSM